MDFFDPNKIFPIKSKLTYATKEDSLFKRLLITAIEVATGRPKLERVYQEIKDMNIPPIEIWKTALDKLNISVDYDSAQLTKIPKNEAVIFIANHPFGIVDGLILGYLVSKVRETFVILVNGVLCREELFQSFFLPIDFNPTKEATQTNINTRKKTMERLRTGEALAIFPSGGVATSPKLWAKAEDLEWKRFVTKIIQMTQATVIPVFVHGQNSWGFQFASHLSMSLRLSLLLREATNKIGKQILINIGDPIPYNSLAHFRNRQELLDFLRRKTFQLSQVDLTTAHH